MAAAAAAAAFFNSAVKSFLKFEFLSFYFLPFFSIFLFDTKKTKKICSSSSSPHHRLLPSSLPRSTPLPRTSRAAVRERPPRSSQRRCWWSSEVRLFLE